MRLKVQFNIILKVRFFFTVLCLIIVRLQRASNAPFHPFAQNTRSARRKLHTALGLRHLNILKSISSMLTMGGLQAFWFENGPRKYLWGQSLSQLTLIFRSIVSKWRAQSARSRKKKPRKSVHMRVAQRRSTLFFCRCKPMVQWRQTRALMLALRNVDQYFPWTLDSTIFENKPGIPSLHAALGLSLLDLSY